LTTTSFRARHDHAQKYVAGSLGARAGSNSRYALILDGDVSLREDLLPSEVVDRCRDLEPANAFVRSFTTTTDGRRTSTARAAARRPSAFSETKTPPAPGRSV